MDVLLVELQSMLLLLHVLLLQLLLLLEELLRGLLKLLGLLLLLLGDNGAGPVGCISRDASVRDPDVDERLHGLHVFVAEQAEQLRHGDKVYKAAVEVSPATGGWVAAVDVPEGVDPV